MRASTSCIWAALFLLIGLCAAQGPAPDCSGALVSLLPCLDYVQGNVSSPSQGCCVGVNGTVQNSPSCLCSLLNSSAIPITVDPARVSQLTTLCNVVAPSSAVCGGSVAPAQSPPVASPPGSVSPVQEPVPSPPVSTPTPPTTAPSTAPPTPSPSVPMGPGVSPTAPMTPSSPPTTAPTVPPAMTPTVSPMAPPAGVPAPASLSTPSPMAPSSESPLPSLSSPPAPPPVADNNNHGSVMAASFLVSGFAMVLSAILFV